MMGRGLVLLLAQLTLCLGSAETDKLHKKSGQLAEQLLRLQFYVEEQTRADGHSGVKTMRRRYHGTRPYHGTYHADNWTVAAMHDHSDYPDTLGMGEITAVLNGIEFKTRHNDYQFSRKSTTSSTYGATELIPFPDVPPSVLSKNTVNKQINEMKKYFKAWATQDTSIRSDYKDYFKANLCYLEGAWNPADPDEKPVAFFSTRHALDACSWDDLFQKTFFESNSGSKNNLENYAHLPTKVWAYDEATKEVVFGQWNYTMLCHPLDDDLPLNRLRAVDDLATRMSVKETYADYLQSTHARFALNPADTNNFCDVHNNYGLLDKIMRQIPGKNNYGAVLYDQTFGNTIYRYDDTPPLTELNAAYYHRALQNQLTGAMGVKQRFRGFNDEHLWVALNDQPEVMPVVTKDCDASCGNCLTYTQRWSYAIPLEIVYNTPLHKWNPYDILYKGDKDSPLGKTVYDGPLGIGTRDGTNHPDKAWNGTNGVEFYQIPDAFFSSGEIGDDPADTPLDPAYILDQSGNIRAVRSSGIRTILPQIGLLGKLRTRFAIHPVHGEGSPVWQELSALADIIMEPAKYASMIRDPTGINC